MNTKKPLLSPVEIVSRLDYTRPSSAWLYSVPLAVQKALDAWPDRPGAKYLHHALSCASGVSKYERGLVALDKLVNQLICLCAYILICCIYQVLHRA